MRITIEHITRYVWSRAAPYSLQCLRLTPSSFEGHAVVSWGVTVEPAAKLMASTDAFGNPLTLATIDGLHDAIEIKAAGVVDVEGRNGVVAGAPERVPLRVYLRRTALTDATPAVAALAEGLTAGDRIAGLHMLAARIRDRIDYVPGITASTTTAAEALDHAKGVCQDHAHVFIAAARSAAVPARYVTGYLLLDSGADAPAHHAWAEAWVEGLGWVGFDVANRICPTERYVRLAVGLDAASAAPIRGTRRSGPDEERLEVAVRVAQAAGAGQQ